MLIGVFQLLQAKREEINAYQKYIEAFQGYWTIRTDLEKAVGYRLLFSEEKISESSGTAVTPLDSHTHHHGGHS
jgi:cobalt-zinc-cadmium efflux system outer membrane protein